MNHIFRFSFFTLLAALLVACATNRTISTDMAVLAERYPPESIQTWSLSRTALTDVAAARDEIEERSKRGQARCFKKFFVANCMDEVKDQQRIDLSFLRKIEIEANAFQRKAKAVERDESLSERQRQAGSAPIKNLIPLPGDIRINKPSAGSDNKPAN